MVNTVLCPECGKEIEISQALRHELEEKALGEIRKKHNSELADMTRQLADLKRKDEERDLIMEKKMVEREEKIKNELAKKTEEEHHLKDLEKDKKLQDSLVQIEELKRKLQQGSQQTQGEVMELELERLLTAEFPNDKISPVAKGIRGADVIQEVWDRNGARCGVILWESKNAKWSEAWIDKLKEDQRALKAELCVIVSENLPENVKTAVFRDGVWIVQRGFAVGIAMALRANLIQANHIKKSVAGKNDKMEILYNYLSGVEFGHRLESVLESYSQMQEELEKEKRWFALKWAKEEKSMRTVVDSLYGMHGDLQAIMGASLPEMLDPKNKDTIKLMGEK